MILIKSKLFPIIVFFTSLFIPKRFGGYNIGPINFIEPRYKNDIGLINHEIHHSRQFWSNPIKYTFGRWLKYFKFLPKSIILWSEKKTYEYELDAYAFQLAIYICEEKYPIESAYNVLLPKFVYYIMTKYNIKYLQLNSIKIKNELWVKTSFYVAKYDTYRNLIVKKGE